MTVRYCVHLISQFQCAVYCDLLRTSQLHFFTFREHSWVLDSFSITKAGECLLMEKVMHDIVFEITKSMVGTRVFLVDSYAVCQEIQPFYGNEEPIFVFREIFCWSPSWTSWFRCIFLDINSPRAILTARSHVI